MKILLDDERSDTLEFFSESIGNFGYKVGIAKNSDEIDQMLADNHHDIVLTSGHYKTCEHDRQIRTKFPFVFVAGIKNSINGHEEPAARADHYLVRPFGKSALLQAIENSLR